MCTRSPTMVTPSFRLALARRWTDRVVVTQ
ncbi:Uncharacterised protein [Vibrio cholerae]|nr:Uncharacterised protein [Vibrio cholerae]